jgi:hypothetical protein
MLHAKRRPVEKRAELLGALLRPSIKLQPREVTAPPQTRGRSEMTVWMPLAWGGEALPAARELRALPPRDPEVCLDHTAE